MNQLEVKWSGEVRQKTHDDNWVELYKERITLNHTSTLGFIRKQPIGGATKPPILLVHGFAQNRYTWHTSIRSMSAWLAAQGHDVWNLELRGHGWADTTNQNSASRLEDYADDIVLASEAMPNPAYWIGHSMGGGAIYAAAAKTKPLKCLGIIGIGAVFHFGQGNPLMNFVCRLSRKIAKRIPLKDTVVHTRGAGHVLNRLFPILDTMGYLGPASGWWPGTIERELAEERILNGFDRTNINIWYEMSHLAKEPCFPYEKEWSRIEDLPIWIILGDQDHLLTEIDGRPAYDLSNSKRKRLTILNNNDHETHWGHLDIILGKLAPKYVWEPISLWIEAETSLQP